MANELKRLEEHFTFVRGLVPWMGFNEVQINYRVEERYAGKTKYSPFRMFALAFDGIFSFSSFPPSLDLAARTLHHPLRRRVRHLLAGFVHTGAASKAAAGLHS